MKLFLTLVAFSLGYGFLLFGFSKRVSEQTIQFWMKYSYFELLGVKDADDYRKIYFAGLSIGLVALSIIFASAMVLSLQN